MMGRNFSEILRNELNFQNIVVKELSARTKIPVTTLDSYLRTNSAAPSAVNAVKIAQALQVSVEYLITGKEPKNGQKKAIQSRERREIIRRIDNLNPRQCRAILDLIAAFEIKTTQDCHAKDLYSIAAVPAAPYLL
jgi:transcriptional regulator with XRE-family HTH domain